MQIFAPVRMDFIPSTELGWYEVYEKFASIDHTTSRLPSIVDFLIINKYEVRGQSLL
jgi:hypothetical protein